MIVNLVNKINDMTKSKHARPRARHEIKAEITFFLSTSTSLVYRLRIQKGRLEEGFEEALQITQASDVTTSFF